VLEWLVVPVTVYSDIAVCGHIGTCASCYHINKVYGVERHGAVSPWHYCIVSSFTVFTQPAEAIVETVASVDLLAFEHLVVCRVVRDV
jgi:hypothetical protein